MNSDPVCASWMMADGTEWKSSVVVYWNASGAIGVSIELTMDGEVVAATTTTDVT